MIFKVFRFECLQCGARRSSLQWASDPQPVCSCGLVMMPESEPQRAHGVIGDDIPGGMTLDHVALKNGEPQRFYSKAAVREAARKAGWTLYGETPKHTKHREV